jgi:hypothetical protein
VRRESEIRARRPNLILLRFTCGLTASLAALALLQACDASGLKAGGQKSTNRTSAVTVAAPVSPTTARAAPPATRGPHTEKWIDLQVGDCLTQLPPNDPSVVTVTSVECASPHAAEVYFRGPMVVNAAIADVANRKCAAGFSQYTGRPIDGSSFATMYLIDSNQDRTADNPAPSTVICLLHATNDQPLTESARR